MEAEAKKSLGQHWLNDESILKKICSLAELKSNDTVLEIGPGQGSLTIFLAESGAQIIGLEIDEELLSTLKTKFAECSNVKIEQGDIRTFNLNSLPDNYKIVANIPYYLTAYLLRLLTTAANKPALGVFLVQKEVAERLAAAPGNMSLIAVVTQLHYRTELGPMVPAKFFSPPPKVDSQVIFLKRKDVQQMSNTKGLIKLIKVGFSSRRKTLANNIASGLTLDKTITLEAIKNAGLDLNVRAQELSLSEWNKLRELINT